MKKELKPYLVHRPYCTPLDVVVVASDKKDAIAISTKEFGHALGTSAKKVTKKGVVLSTGTSTLNLT